MKRRRAARRSRLIALVQRCAGRAAAAASRVRSATPASRSAPWRSSCRKPGNAKPLFAHEAAKPMNPASVMKLVTTFAALELLGPDYRWTTAGVSRRSARRRRPARQPRAQGPWRSQDHDRAVAGVHGDAARRRASSAIDGDLVLDRSFFAPFAHDPAAFDGEPLKPYNVGPDALLVNFKSVQVRLRARMPRATARR